MISMKNYGKTHSQPVLSTHISSEVPLGSLLLPDKPIYLWSGLWRKGPIIQRSTLRSPLAHQQVHFLSLASLLHSPRKLTQLQKQMEMCTQTARTNKPSLAQVIWFLLANTKCLRRDNTEISAYKKIQKRNKCTSDDPWNSWWFLPVSPKWPAVAIRD